MVFLTACQPDQKPNIILITFDTTRSDRIGVYGKQNAMTPVIDQLAQDGVLYKHALSPVPITLPSHSSIMTGKVPFTHGVRDNGLFILSEDNITLAEILKKNGYKTAAAIGAFPLISEFGINQGFDYFDEHIVQNKESIYVPDSIFKKGLFFDERSASQVNQAIIPWIAENHESAFFVWLHYYDPHQPHNPPYPYNHGFVNDLYQGEIAYADESLGDIINQLKDLDKYDNTLIVFTSDHGEGNGEHNEASHVSLIYNSTQQVPLIIKYPFQQYAKSKVNNWVGLIDIFPTVLDVVGINFDDDIQGQILPVKDNPDMNQNRELYAETLSAKLSRGWGEQRGLIKNNFKYIYGPKKELYNLIKDPFEVNNLIDINPALASDMKKALQDYIDEHQNGNSNNRINVSEDTLNTLRGLGYVQITSNSIEQFEEKLNDEGDAPQLHIQSLSAYNDAKNLLLEGKYIDANRLLNSLLETDPNNLSAIELKIFSEIYLRNFSTAKELIQKTSKEPVWNHFTSKKIIFFSQNQP